MPVAGLRRSCVRGNMRLDQANCHRLLSVFAMSLSTLARTACHLSRSGQIQDIPVETTQNQAIAVLKSSKQYLGMHYQVMPRKFQGRSSRYSRQQLCTVATRGTRQSSITENPKQFNCAIFAIHDSFQEISTGESAECASKISTPSDVKITYLLASFTHNSFAIRTDVQIRTDKARHN